MAKASKRGLFHKKTLARKISRLAKQANAAAKKAK
jgi:ribosomal protein S20